MLLNPGSFVTISHYSLTSVFRSTVLAANGNNVEVKLPKECMRSNFLVGDPLAVAYEVRNLPKIKGARVSHYNAEEAVLIFVEDTYEEEVKMRSYERFPVSLYADYRVVEEMGNRKSYALVKDISEYGLQVYSKESHYKGLRLSMDIYITRDILSLEAEILRKTERDGYYEYGLRIKHRGPYVHSHIKDYIKKSEIELISCFSRV